MSVNDLRITEVMYNPGPNGFQYIEVTNTGNTPVSAGDFNVGNSDFSPEYYSGDFAFGGGDTPTIAAGASIILVPVLPDFSGEILIPPTLVTLADFEAAYGALPQGAVFVSYPAFFGPVDGDLLAGARAYTISGDDLFADSVFIPGTATEGQSISVSLQDGAVSAGAPTPGTTEPAPPVEPSGEVINGTSGRDVLDGTAGDDVITADRGNDDINGGNGNDDVFGGNGNDDISGGNGDDLIEGGGQSDAIYGGAGNDDIFGGKGHDSISGGNGEDDIFGGSGNDVINGGGDNDIIFGDHGKDVISGGNGDDDIYGGISNDTLNGNNGDDALFGGRGQDILRGGADKDVLDGGSQADTLNGGAGDDELIGGLGDDRLVGGAGADTFVFAGVTNKDVIVDFEMGIDKIDFTAYGPVSDAEAIAISSQVGNNVLLDLKSNGEITLRNIDLAELSLNDFIYIPDDIYVAT